MTEDRALVGTSDTAKDSTKKTTLAVLARLIKVVAPTPVLTECHN
jgi:hypothetical protein